MDGSIRRREAAVRRSRAEAPRAIRRPLQPRPGPASGRTGSERFEKGGDILTIEDAAARRGTPTIVTHVDGEPAAPWVEAFAAAFPGWRVFPGDAVPPGADPDVRLVVVWGAPPGFFGRFPNLARIVSASTGLDHLRRDPSRPEGVPVLARRDPDGPRTMAEFVLLQVLLHHRGVGACLLDRGSRRWDAVTAGPLAERRVGVLGFGPMARATADLLASFGCAVTAWSRSARTHGTVEVRSGWDRLDGVFEGADTLVNLLPSTPDTVGLIDARRLALLPRGAGLVNVGRGDALDTAALLRALDAGHLSIASLDVLPVEPPAPDDPVWTHPRVILTPHMASLAVPATFARWVAAEVAPGLAGPRPTA